MRCVWSTPILALVTLTLALFTFELFIGQTQNTFFPNPGDKIRNLYQPRQSDVLCTARTKNQCSCESTIVIYVLDTPKQSRLLRASIDSLRNIGLFQGHILVYSSETHLNQPLSPRTHVITHQFNPAQVFNDASLLVPTPVEFVIAVHPNLLFRSVMCDLFKTAESKRGGFFAFPISSLDDDGGASVIAFDRSSQAETCLRVWATNRMAQNFNMYAPAFTNSRDCATKLFYGSRIKTVSLEELTARGPALFVSIVDMTNLVDNHLQEIRYYGAKFLNLDPQAFSSDLSVGRLLMRGAGYYQDDPRSGLSNECPEFDQRFAFVYLASRQWTGSRIFRASLESLRSVGRFGGQIIILTDDVQCLRQNLGSELLGPETIGVTNVVSTRHDIQLLQALDIAWNNALPDVQRLILIDPDMIIGASLCNFFSEVSEKPEPLLLFKDKTALSSHRLLSVIVSSREIPVECLQSLQDANHRPRTGIRSNRISVREMNCKPPPGLLPSKFLVIPNLKEIALSKPESAPFFHLTVHHRLQQIPKDLVVEFFNYLSLTTDPLGETHCSGRAHFQL